MENDRLNYLIVFFIFMFEIIDQRIKMKCAMYMQCTHMNQQKQRMENKKLAKYLFDHVGIMNLVRWSSK